MNTTTDTPRQPVEARKISDAKERMEFLPRHFGRHMLTVEDAVYTFMCHLVDQYTGGFWHFYELSNGGGYLAPEMGTEKVMVRVDGNGFSGEMSAEAAGITACLFALSHLSFQVHTDTISNHFYQLREFALEHPERRAIFAAID
jgi:hypothetical protein